MAVTRVTPLRDMTETSPFKAAIVLAACAAIFLALALAAQGEALASFDAGLLTGLRNPAELSDPIGPLWLEEAARDVTALGGTFLIFLAAFGVAILLLLNGAPKLAAFSILSLLGAQLLSETLKGLFDRPRPDLVPHEVAVYSASLPSGHAMMAAAAYFSLAFALHRQFERARNRNALYLAAAMLTFLVGASRVYLGVHWPSDVLAGWCAGVAWAVAASLIYRRIVR